MKTLGLIGGTSWESTVDYYRRLNEGVRDRLGGLHSCRMILSSVDFAPLAERMSAGDWDNVAERLVAEARLLARAGAQAILIGSNTLHKVAARVAGAVEVPVLDIRDACGAALVAAGVRRPLLLGTRYTMADDFFRGYLNARFGVEAQVPSADDQALVDRVIFDQLCKGVVTPASRSAYLAVLARSPQADGVIFGCTEIGMLLDPESCGRPVFDNLRLHVGAALTFALGNA